MVPLPLPHWVADSIWQVMNLTEWAALHTELWPLVHTQTRDPSIFPCSMKMLGSHTSPIRASQPFLPWGGMQWHCIPLASSQYSYKASGPKHSPNTTRTMQGTSYSQRGSRWWIYHTEGDSCYYMWKHVTLHNQIFIYIFPFYMWEKQVWSFAALLKGSALRVHYNFYLGTQ